MSPSHAEPFYLDEQWPHMRDAGYPDGTYCTVDANSAYPTWWALFCNTVVAEK
jgi:hypothetical protein